MEAALNLVGYFDMVFSNIADQGEEKKVVGKGE
jgi:hypothetical protein